MSLKAQNPRVPQAQLYRGISRTQLVLYGVGTIVGAGIYALLGEVAAVAGAFSPLSFLGAAVAIAFSALSFGELSARFPVAAGEAEFVVQGFGLPVLATIVGLLVAAAGCISAATLCTAFVGYAHSFVDLPDALMTVAVCALLGATSLSGVSHAVGLAVTLTVLEVLGLVVVGLACAASLMGLVDLVPATEAVVGSGVASSAPGLLGVASGSLLAVYAFLGFEDMVNLAQEVDEPERNMPGAIVAAVVISTLLYVSFTWLATAAVPAELLAGSQAPLATILTKTIGTGDRAISAVSLAAMMNGILVQLIMSSRVLFGLAERGRLPSVLARVGARTQTPTVATVVSLLAIVSLALWLPLGQLARATSMVALVIFVLVDLALVAIKLRGERPAHPSVVELPLYVPILGAILGGAFLVFGAVR